MLTSVLLRADRMAARGELMAVPASLMAIRGEPTAASVSLMTIRAEAIAVPASLMAIRGDPTAASVSLMAIRAEPMAVPASLMVIREDQTVSEVSFQILSTMIPVSRILMAPGAVLKDHPHSDLSTIPDRACLSEPLQAEVEKEKQAEMDFLCLY